MHSLQKFLSFFVHLLTAFTKHTVCLDILTNYLKQFRTSFVSAPSSAPAFSSSLRNRWSAAAASCSPPLRCSVPSLRNVWPSSLRRTPLRSWGTISRNERYSFLCLFCLPKICQIYSEMSSYCSPLVLLGYPWLLGLLQASRTLLWPEERSQSRDGNSCHHQKISCEIYE